MSQAKRHYLVIGAGIVGSSCAWHLLREGHEVTLVDSRLPGQATSFGNAGCISANAVIPFSYPGVIRQIPNWLLDPKGPLYIRWRDLSQVIPWLWRFWRSGSMEQVEAIARAQTALMDTVRADFDFILRETGAEWLRRKNGFIMLYDREADFQRDAWQFELRRKLGQEWKRLSLSELRELEPALAEGEAASGRVAIFDGVWEHLLDPGEVTRSIAESSFAHGANWVQQSVTALESSGDIVRVRLQSGETIEPDGVVIAAGVWSGELLRPLGARVPLAAKRGYHTMVHNPNVELGRPVMAASRWFMLTPMRLGLRLAGTAEFAAIDAAPDYRRAKILLDHARSYLPDLKGESYSEWLGQRPMMPDSKPVIGALPGHPSVLCAFGHGHYGLTQGPTTGRIIADLAGGRTPQIDLRPFAVDRF